MLMPFFIGGYYICMNYSPRTVQETVYGMCLACAILFFMMFFISLILFWLTHAKQKSAWGTTLVLVGNFIFPSFMHVVRTMLPALEQQRYVVPLWLLILILIGYGGWYIIAKHKNVLKVVTIYSILLMGYGFIHLACAIRLPSSATEQLFQEITKPISSPYEPGRMQSNDSLPDIYYLLTDGYTSPQSLKTYWRDDDSIFCATLAHRGFIITKESRSFARYTTYSMASTLNMSADQRILQQDWDFPVRLIRYNVTMLFLQNHAYHLYNYSPFAIESLSPFYEETYLAEGVVASAKQVFVSTLFYDLIDEGIKNMSGDMIDRILSDVLSLAHSSRTFPIFVYAHLPVPHYPYVLDEKGGKVGWFHNASHNDKYAYLRQIHGVNSLLIPFIDSIQAASHRRTIIIIQGDHGFRYFPEPVKYQEGFTILNAYYFPDQNYSGISPAISPYNTFRVILNKYFDTKLPLLPDTLSGIRYHGSR
jgi:hypothetical protein